MIENLWGFMNFRWKASLLTGVLAACTMTIPTATAAQVVDEPPAANERLALIVAQYAAQHPHDYVGLERTIVAHVGDSVTFAVAGRGGVSAVEAQQLYRQATAQGENGAAGVLDVPANSFNVTGSWYHIRDQYGEWWNATGNWNFRDNYVNGSDPGDASGIAADVPDCWVPDGEWISAFDYQGNRYGGALIRQNAPLTASVYDVDDATSGFKLLTDNGSHTLSFKRHSTGCAGQPLQARYYYEHNQDGGAVGASASASPGSR